ncbi:hypothetical protein K439DRAFT_1621263 [Ramaria rubella]|nr:hypothetical protein K439DRAFT_1621263 [Ramaria rubella]
MAQSINDVSSDGREASKYKRFTDHSSPPPDIYSPTSPESEHHTEEGQLRANPTDLTDDHWPLSEDLRVLSIQLRSHTCTLLIEDSDNCRSTMILLVLTGFSKECFTIDELISAIINHLETQYLSEQLLESFATGMDYSMLRAGEAHAVESLDVWQDGCQVLDKLSTILICMLSHRDERNIMTRVPSATLWGFPEMDLLYILYLVPECVKNDSSTYAAGSNTNQFRGIVWHPACLVKRPDTVTKATDLLVDYVQHGTESKRWLQRTRILQTDLTGRVVERVDYSESELNRAPTAYSGSTSTHGTFWSQTSRHIRRAFVGY